jgi:hypothetical protein
MFMVAALPEAVVGHINVEADQGVEHGRCAPNAGALAGAAIEDGQVAVQVQCPNLAADQPAVGVAHAEDADAAAQPLQLQRALGHEVAQQRAAGVGRRGELDGVVHPGRDLLVGAR